MELLGGILFISILALPFAILGVGIWGGIRLGGKINRHIDPEGAARDAARLHAMQRRLRLRR